MAKYVHIETGDIKTQGQWRKHYSNVSLPRTWTPETVRSLNLAVIFATPDAIVGPYQRSVRDGVEQDANGNWVEKHIAVDLFSATGTSKTGRVTKRQHEEAYQADLDVKLSKVVRITRDKLIAETDWMAMSDVTMSNDVAGYRQSLRDLTSHSNFPNLEADDWPTKP